MSARPRVLFVDPCLNPPGGGLAVLCWMMEALKADHDITLMSAAPLDLAAVNAAFGTSLDQAEVRMDVAPSPDGFPERFIPKLAALPMLRRYRLLQRARGTASAFEAVIATDNESDVGPRALQYIHFPSMLWHPDRREIPQQIEQLFYARLFATLTRYSRRRMRQNLTLTNSRWTAELTRRVHGIRCQILHPPALGRAGHRAWEDREPIFAAIGRVAPDKRVEDAIRIVKQVRQSNPAVRLRILGFGSHGPYVGRIAEIARREGDWIELLLDRPRAEMLTKLEECRYGIHAMHHEHYGMGVAELVRAGTIPFAHASGGQAEILGGLPELLYTDHADAVSRIRRVLSDSALRSRISGVLGERRESLSTDHFCREFRAIVATALASERSH